jgi:uncharacterized protein YndB with AHSA1/START domain/DNA-binding transcriptional ArsR family regulator
MDSDEVFRALADPHRRTLLDLLRVKDGRTLSELEKHLPMTRFGCMKHLKLLEEAGLITTRKIGRERLHYLNAVPIRQVYERWVSQFAEPWARALTGLASHMESEAMSTKPSLVMHVFIRTTPERLWQALTDGEFTRQYYFGTRVESAWKPGAPYVYVAPDGAAMIKGDVVESDPPKKLVTTFTPGWLPPESPPHLSKVTFEIERQGDACKLTMIHDGLEPDSPLTAGFTDGWSKILSGLKTLLETGEPLGLTAM